MFFQALEYLEANYKEYKIRKVKRLPVSGAFHSKLMEPAKEVFQKALKKSEIKDPAIWVYSNVDGHVYRNAEHIRKQLPKQVNHIDYCCYIIFLNRIFFTVHFGLIVVISDYFSIFVIYQSMQKRLGQICFRPIVLQENDTK